ncbi:MAG: class I SAM-dependent methyltransferase [Elusimicrobia bacterium]|nr:class I SAM-dependent methyltransferase [Elusimicrobiota bacterium]
MKIKLYTKGYDEELLKKVDNQGGQFTAEELTWLTEQELGRQYETRQKHLEAEFGPGYKKLETVPWLVDFIRAHGLRNIVSLGAGTCGLEYLLSCCLGRSVRITAADFNKFLIAKAQEHFGDSLDAVSFDFFKDRFAEIKNAPFDLAVFYGSAYVMDDDDFVRLFRDIRKSGCARVIDFHGGFLNGRQVLRKRVSSWLDACPRLKAAVKAALRLPPQKDGYRGKFHGYGRSRSALELLYRQAGWEIGEVVSLADSYGYIAVLRDPQ